MAVFLILDPAKGRCAAIKVFLEPQHKVLECRTLQEANAACPGQHFKGVFVAWPEALPTGKSASPEVAWTSDYVVIMTEAGASKSAARAWKEQVLPDAELMFMDIPSGYLTAGEITRTVGHILGTPEAVFPEVMGMRRPMVEVLAAAARASANDRPVLICGEVGTGKETLARWIHTRSSRGLAGGSFEIFRCAGLDSAAAFSELFGHEKGAFSWATRSRPGRAQAADRGTLFIPEICDLEMALQYRLLRLLEAPGAGVEPLGGDECSGIDVRIIAASRFALSQKLGGALSEELYYKLRQNYLEIPPLRARPGDIAELADFFVRRQQGSSYRGVAWDPQALSILQNYPWPGNLNELDSVIREIASKTEPPTGISVHLLPTNMTKYQDSPQAGGKGHNLRALPQEPIILDGYRTVKLLAETKNSRVYLAASEFNRDFLVVMKLLQLENHAQAEAVKKAIALYEEGDEAKKFMIPIHHANTISENLYILVVACLDDLRGNRQQIKPSLYQPRTLFERIREIWLKGDPGAQDVRVMIEIIGYLKDTLSVLEFFHDNDLVMNDMKPANFGFYKGRLVVVDFGSITYLGQPPHESTDEYDPPEERFGTPAEDIYAVVKILAEAVYGIPPGELQPDTGRKRLEQECLAKGRLSDKLCWTIIKKGMAKDPSERYRSASELREDLSELETKLREG